MAVTTTLVLSALCAGTVNGMGWGFGAAPVATHALADIRPERNNTLSKVFAEAMVMLSDMPNMPHCNQAATKDLVHSCQSYDSAASAQSPRSTQGELESFQQQFAIRMSHCELQNAGQSSPSACEQIVIDGSTASASQTTSCLDALFQNNNMWTTYHGMKNNGAVLCYAMRAEQDKEEKLRLLMFLAEKVSDIGSAVDFAKHDLDQLAQTLDDVQRSTRNFHQDMVDSTKGIQSEVKKSFDAIREDTSGISDLVQSFSSSMGQVKQDLEQHVNRVHHAFNQVQAAGDKREAEWTKHLADVQSHIHNFYQHQVEILLTDLNQRVYALTDDLDIARRVTADMLNQFGTLEDHLVNSNQKAGDLVGTIGNASEAVVQTFARMDDVATPVVDKLQMVASTLERLGPGWTSIMQILQTLSKLDPNSFMMSYAIILPFAAVAWWWIGTSGTIVILIAACGPALLIASIRPSQVTQPVGDAHPSFFCYAPYLSMLACFMAGLGAAAIISHLRRGRKYDPAAQLDPYTGLDDMEIEEQRQTRIRL
ncbi:hypothetical protein BST61_g5279 [Cercospora zeina]